MSIRRLLMSRDEPFIRANFPSSMEGNIVTWNSLLSVDDTIDTTINGLTMSYKDDGICVSGTPTATAVRHNLLKDSSKKYIDYLHKYIFFGTFKNGSSSTYRLDSQVGTRWINEYGDGTLFDANIDDYFTSVRFVVYTKAGNIEGVLKPNMIDLTSLGLTTIQQFVEYMGYSSINDMPIYPYQVGVVCVIHNGNLYRI